MTRRLERWLLAPGSPRRLAQLRFLVIGYALGWLAFTTPELIDLGGLDPSRFRPVGVVRMLRVGPASSATITAWLAVTVLAGATALAGRSYRVSAPVFAAGFLWLTTYQNSWGKLLHTENLLVLHLAILATAAAADVPVLRRTGPEVPSTPRHGWPVRVMAMATVLAYVVAGVSKLRHSEWAWLDPENLRNWVAYDLVRKDLFGDPYLPIARPALEHPWVFAAPMLFTLVVELAAPVALLSRRVAWAWSVGAWTLHVSVLAVMSVAFPYHLTGIALLPVLLAASEGSRRTVRRPPRTLRTATIGDGL